MFQKHEKKLGEEKEVWKRCEKACLHNSCEIHLTEDEQKAEEKRKMGKGTALSKV